MKYTILPPPPAPLVIKAEVIYSGPGFFPQIAYTFDQEMVNNSFATPGQFTYVRNSGGTLATFPTNGQWGLGDDGKIRVFSLITIATPDLTNPENDITGSYSITGGNNDLKSLDGAFLEAFTNIPLTFIDQS